MANLNPIDAGMDRREQNVLAMALYSVLVAPIDPAPKSPEELRRAISPLMELIPELKAYDTDSKEGREEFPRTASALLNLGSLIRAGIAKEELHNSDSGEVGLSAALYVTPAALEHQSKADQRAQEIFQAEYRRFSGQQSELQRITIEQFQKLVELYSPLFSPKEETDRYLNTKAVALALVYGDLFKLPHIKSELEKGLKEADVADHDIALQQAFNPENIGKVSHLFPSLGTLPPSYANRISSEVIQGVNLGHVLQVENCAASLTSTAALAKDPAALKCWLLANLMDIAAARARSDNPDSWIGSALMNRSLGQGLLDFSSELASLKEGSEVQFFDAVHRRISARPYYASIHEDTDLDEKTKAAVYRLSRFLSFETDNRSLPELIASWKRMEVDDQKLLSAFFINSGFDPSEPKIIVTYLPYVFTQLYAKHFDLPQALDGALRSIRNALNARDDYDWNRKGGTLDGLLTISGQNCWFNQLRNLTKDQLLKDLGFEVVENAGKTPELKLKS
jgi:hypothetical protein